jgi:hypothetical protein
MGSTIQKGMTDHEYIKNEIQWLKELSETEFRAVREAVNKVEATNKEAVDKVENTYKSYRDQQNEWRNQIKDQTATFVTRRELLGAVLAAVGIAISIMQLLK